MKITHVFSNKQSNTTTYVALHRKCIRLLLSRPNCTAVQPARMMARKAS